MVAELCKKDGFGSKKISEGLGDGPVVISMCSSCRGPKFPAPALSDS